MATRPLAEIPADELAALWSTVLPYRYRVTPQLLSSNTIDHSLFLPELSLATMQGDQLTGFVAAKSSGAGNIYAGEPSGQIHVSCLVAPSEAVAQELLDPILATGRPLVFGQDLGHFFPGVPEDCPNLLTQLKSAGFTPTERLSVDVQRDLQGFEPPAKAIHSLHTAGAVVEQLSESDLPALDAFFAQEFPGRWRYDTIERCCRKEREFHNVYVLKKSEEVVGFALTQTWDSTKHPIAGAVWHLDLGENWGALGPVGVAKSVRSEGLGGAVLSLALASLRDRGVRNCAIDWTNLVDFYGKYGFQVSRRYVTMLHAGLG